MPSWLMNKVFTIWQLLCDLYEIVDFGSLADARGAKGAAVIVVQAPTSTSSANFHVPDSAL